MAKNIFEAIKKTNFAGGGKLESFTPRRHDSRPTKALPGSPEKIEVLARRIEKGVELHHHDDVINWDDLAEVD